jgi:protein-glutamine gamma-glutamyltransferase
VFTSTVKENQHKAEALKGIEFEDYFVFTSYMMVFCGTISLAISGGISIGLALLVGIALFITWKLEKRTWKLSEKAGLIIILSSFPLFYFDWRYQISSVQLIDYYRASVSALIHLILLLSFIKLLQVKTDRNWIFLYLISFFQILLAAGLSVSPQFLVVLCVYMFFALATIICFEIKKAKRIVENTRAIRIQKVDEPLDKAPGLLKKKRYYQRKIIKTSHLAGVAFCLLLLILILALPIFLVTPRFSGNMLARLNSGSMSGIVGFSDTITLGGQGRLEQGESVVMRVRVEQQSQSPRPYIRWRGVALDHFDGKGWVRSINAKKDIMGSTSGIFSLSSLGSLNQLAELTTQTFYLEPINKSVLFVAPRAIALQGDFSKIQSDIEDGVSTQYPFSNRISYRVYSDTKLPDIDQLQSDLMTYPLSEDRYKQLPENVDLRIKDLAERVIKERGANNRYDKALAIKDWLSGNFKYSLELRAKGDDPLSDFLFNVQAGHCEYFSTAMTVMLRTQNIDARVVNGFQMGEYNDAAGVYTVRERDAHSWVEVYFPSTRSWVSFDPTPADTQSNANRASSFRGLLNKYTEAIEMLWIQYVVAYDRQEQKQLATSVKDRINSYSSSVFRGADGLLDNITVWWQYIKLLLLSLRPSSFISWIKIILLITAITILCASSIILSFRFYRKYVSGSLRGKGRTSGTTVIDFYDRMIKSLAVHGIHRTNDQTPLEFASSIGIPEALIVTHAYNQVRFGSVDLSSAQIKQIEECLKKISEKSYEENRIRKFRVPEKSGR